MKAPTTVLLALALALAAPALALAHDDATLDAMETPNGGQVRMAGPYHFELVLADNEVSIYLTDHDDVPVPSEGVGGHLIVLSGERSRIAVAPVGDNRLAGRGTFERSPDMKAVLSLTFPDGETWQARFTPGNPGGQG
ncbi:hypothetical protein [Thiocapsa roseopersicina]|uniref:Uncharacterized protein n=1 Tax=Thiocapsa roseopersicina TaxID=1058 RepID=A0A1H2W8C8_THIRO|nr:hypothetical protein [Thiocapsa roseopersicina]SDW76716.1 hypothetical protein SAMN05421783_10885 [Thiocapsa roseopersicina]